MMTIYYSYLLSILYSLLIIHWTNAASLRSLSRSSSKWSLDRRQPSFIMNIEVSTPEPILFRRRPILISRERQRRWSKDDDDEIEIPIDNPPTIVSNDISSYNPIISEIEPSLLRQDLDIINQTDELTTTVINEDISENNNNNTNIENIFQSTVESEILLTNDTDINQNISNVFNINESIKNNETEISSTSISITQPIEETSTINEFELDTAIIVFDYTTIPPVTIDASQTTIDSGTEMLLEYNTTNVSVTTNIIDEIQNDTMPIQQPTDSTIITSTVTRNDTEVTDKMIDDNTTTILSDTIQNSTEKIDQTIIFDTTQSHTEVVDQAIDNVTMISDDTSTVIYTEENEVVPANNAKPTCDQSCQCFRKCPYGFEIINDTCECNPPCENYQCFGNDTCSVLKTGQPICKPENEFEHDRPIGCYQPQVAGYHDNDVRYYDRWYYNPDQNTCHSFIYRGLGGNENNFQTLNECRLECIICASLPDSGSCFGYTSMWYYDYKKNQCSEFTYSGCKGNENKFIYKQNCIDTCITRILNL